MKGEEQTSSTIFVLGFIILIGLLVAAVFSAFGGIKVPGAEKQATLDDRESIANHLADLAERCWTQSEGGTSSRVIDCFQVEVTPNEEVREEHITGNVDAFDTANLFMDTIQAGTQTTVKVRYNTSDILITEFQVCDPSQGDTCELAKCSCDTRCDPSAPNTDAFGCVEE